MQTVDLSIEEKSSEGQMSPSLPESPSVVILVDDDVWMRKAWEICFESQSFELRCFESYDQLFSESLDLSKQTRFFLDLYIGNQLEGWAAAEKLYTMGFHELYISTGLDAEYVDKPYFVKAVVSKDPTVVLDEIFSS